jgi:prepilin-type processing-associated H-X9-DG protein
MMAVQNYAAQNKGFIPGSPNTTGYGLFFTPYTQINCPGISQIWDWQAPLAKYMAIKFEEGGTQNQRINRFIKLIEHPSFACPENDVVATAFTGSGGPNFPASKWISYSTAMVFLLRNSADLPGFTTPSPTQRTNGPSFYNPPPGYSPKLTKVGKSSLKIYVGDGGRFSAGDPPTMNLDYVGSTGGAYSDPGAWSRFSRAWDRARAPGNGGTTLDARVLSFRHGRTTVGGNADTYRANFAFFDGHVESLGDLEAANPKFWLPKGTSYATGTGEQYPDGAAKYSTGLPNPSIMPE